MREIKFRAWDKLNNHFTECTFSIVRGSITKPSEIEIMQYTGLLDTNGKEIYEGDVVRSIVSGDITIVRWLNHLVDSIEYKNNYIMSVGFCFTEPNSDEVEIIGNIYENPELITK